jgi:hypothetical protein
VAAFDVMHGEAQAYERGASDYKDAVTTIISLHYEEKKKAILSGLDREVEAEESELRKARDTAIGRLEEFIDKYSGVSAQPEATPDAMYRLAALYEERARSQEDANDPEGGPKLVAALKPSIRLYKRIIREFPKYKEIAGVYYFLGHLLSDCGRSEESLQVWRSLVCHNHYPYPVSTDPKDPDLDVVQPMPGDHDASYWKAWRNRYPSVEALKKGPKDDTTFVSPYPQSCVALAQPNVPAGQDPKYVAEVWWRIGDWEFDQRDIGGGVIEYEPSAVWDYNRAAAAYIHSMQFNRPPLFGVALYKYAWTLFKQQRYDAAVAAFVRLLRYTDEQEKLTGDPGADFRQEAFTYIAGSLDVTDFFSGPGEDEPYIARADILATAKSPAEAETKLEEAIRNVQDSRIIPQDQRWTIDIYKALALEFRAINQFHNALTVYRLMLDKWPLDPSAPDTQNAIADLYDQLVRSTKVGDERRVYERGILEARTALAKYVGETPWVDANKDNPGAIHRAEELARTGLKSAASAHTANARAAVDQAGQTADPAERLRLLRTALEEYKLAAIGWLGYLRQDENTPDAYTSRCLYADSLHQQVRLEVSLHGFDPTKTPEPTSEEIATAARAATEARDSDEDDQYIDSVGLMVVDLADVDRDLSFQRWDSTGGHQGVEPRKAPRLTGPEGDQKVVVEPLPDVVEQSMRARDEYVERVPPDRDKQNNATEYAFYTAEQYFIYGHFPEAEERFLPLYEQHCGKDDKGYEAWKRLIQMSNFNKDAERSRVLALAEKNHSCAYSEKEKVEESEGVLTDLVLQNAAYSDANKVFEQAKNAPPGPGKDALWRQAGKMYEDALRAAPSHSDAPAAAINSAFCYKQVSEFNKAIDLYQLFIAQYGGDDIMDRLERGGLDPEKKVKVGPNVVEYKERLKYLGMAYEALSTTYYGFFAYPRAADSFARIASNRRFDDSMRVAAAHNAMTLYSNLGDRNGMTRMYDVLTDSKQRLPADQRAEIDYLRASFDFGLWNPNGGDSSANATARRQAIASFEQFHASKKNVPEAAPYSLESAYRVATMLRSANDGAYRGWYKTVLADWDYFRVHPATGGSSTKKGQVLATDGPYSDYGAEADFALIDEQIRAGFDYGTGHHRYAGNVIDIARDVDKDVGDAEKTWRPQLERVASQYGSFEWAAAATARVGSLYDSIRSGLDLATPKYFTPQQEAMLNKLASTADKLDAAGMSDKADEIRQRIDDTKDAVRTKWRATEDRYMEACNQKSVSRYVTAALTARKYNVKNSTVQNAVARLAFFTDYLGDEKMKRYVENTPDPLSPSSMLVYSSGEFLQWRSGVVSAPAPDGQPAPLPVLP